MSTLQITTVRIHIAILTKMILVQNRSEKIATLLTRYLRKVLKNPYLGRKLKKTKKENKTENRNLSVVGL